MVAVHRGAMSAFESRHTDEPTDGRTDADDEEAELLKVGSSVESDRDGQQCDTLGHQRDQQMNLC